jgi:hypothetical protein
MNTSFSRRSEQSSGFGKFALNIEMGDGPSAQSEQLAREQEMGSSHPSSKERGNPKWLSQEDDKEPYGVLFHPGSQKVETERGNYSGCRNRKEPCPDDSGGDTPFDPRKFGDGAYADDRSRDGVRG